MTFKLSDVANEIVDGKVVELTDEQKQVYVDKWNVELAKEPSKKLIRIKKNKIFLILDVILNK